MLHNGTFLQDVGSQNGLIIPNKCTAHHLPGTARFRTKRYITTLHRGT